ncbi:unnamed protein product [Porites evermanni]|uniref:Caspase recruitment domain-containing protein n=1 Tax=Porites evermanni TaxID=104178 RepID=A0ABN8LS58_9CNID|nr:unnamed protein product [Porites evermanni]
MDREDRSLIDQYFPQLAQDIIPVDMLPYLPCLTQTDKEGIKSEEVNRGPYRATILLLDRIQRRTNGFQELVDALRWTGCGHLADLLVPGGEGGHHVDDPLEIDQRRGPAEIQLQPLDQVVAEDVD